MSRPHPDPQIERFVERVLDEREARGLPRRIEDPAVITRIAQILRSAQEQRET